MLCLSQISLAARCGVNRFRHLLMITSNNTEPIQRMIEWMNERSGWMDGWMDGWMVGWMDGWMVGWVIYMQPSKTLVHLERCLLEYRDNALPILRVRANRVSNLVFSTIPLYRPMEVSLYRSKKYGEATSSSSSSSSLYHYHHHHYHHHHHHHHYLESILCSFFKILVELDFVHQSNAASTIYRISPMS